MKTFLLILALVCGFAHAQTATVTDRENRGFQAMRGTSNLGTPSLTEAECVERIRQEVLTRKKTELYKCRNEKVKLGTYSAAPPPPVVCDVPPAPSIATIACAAPLVGSWSQTTTVTYSAPPACTRNVTVSPLAPPNGACTQPAPQPTGPAYYFSDCQAGAAQGCVPGSNANPGTLAAPKQNLAGFNVNGVPGGTRLLFKRGGAWSNFMQLLENRNASAAQPLTFDAYGEGPAPLLRVASGNMFHLGGNWNNTSDDGGYVLRNLKLDGMGTAEWGLWFVQTVRDVVIENTEITGFRIAINSNDSDNHGVRGITLRNSNVHHNRAMGVLGHYNDTIIEGNTFEANNFGGSVFDHGTYIGGGRNIVLRGNRYLRNSVVNGVCQGGNMTFHGQIEGLLIEGNTIEQDAAAPQCWLMSITQGYATAEWFRNAVVRNNRLVNGGNTAMAVQSAPGIVIEGNVIINAQAALQTGINVTGQYSGGDVPDADAVVRNNVMCRRNAAGTGNVVSVNSPGSTVTGNVLRTGADATTGVCAP